MNYSWYTNTVDNRTPDAIHQILAFGTMDDIRVLKKTIGDSKLRELFTRHPKKVYTIPVFNFLKKFVLHIQTSIDEQKYLKSTPRHT